jgi:predicted acetyltransferase
MMGYSPRTFASADELDPTTLEPIAREQASVLGNLFELYAHDFSEYVALDIRPDGRFGLVPSEAWWTEPGHFPFFIRTGQSLCGFALAREGSRVTGEAGVMDVAEFFVLRGVRRKGMGGRAARALFAAFPGRWEVRVRRRNAPALAFWGRVAEERSGRPASRTAFRSEGVDWVVFHLDAPEPGTRLAT